MINLKEIFVTPASPIHGAITAIDCSQRRGVALVVDEQERFLDTITDGDVRRGLLAGFNMDAAVRRLLEIKARMPRPRSIVALEGSTREEWLDLMQKNAIRQLPILDHYGRVKNVVALHELLDEAELRQPISAVVMAGGFGKRLYPLTENLPKPMLPIQGRPLLELVVERLARSGIKNIRVATHFKPEVIMDHFGDGMNFGVNMNYVHEETPLGTAGALGLINRPTTDTLVINGDILTQLAFDKLHCYHRQQQAQLTIAVRSYEHVVPFGVVQIDDSRIISLVEKPSQTWLVNAGIYILSPEIFDHLVPGERLDMTELVERLLRSGKRVVSFPIREKWIDIGRHCDYDLANEELKF